MKKHRMSCLFASSCVIVCFKFPVSAMWFGLFICMWMRWVSYLLSVSLKKPSFELNLFKFCWKQGPPSALCSLFLPLSVSVFRGAGSVCFTGLPVFEHLCAGLMLCCDCPVQVTPLKGDMVIMCPVRERRAVFSHTLLWRFRLTETYLGTRKIPTIHFVHMWTHHGSGCAKTHPFACQGHSFGTNLPLLGEVFDFLQTEGSPCRTVATTAEPLILSPTLFWYQGKGRIQTIAPSVIKGTAQPRIKKAFTVDSSSYCWKVRRRFFHKCTTHVWSFIAKQHCNVLLNDWSGWRPVLKHKNKPWDPRFNFFSKEDIKNIFVPISDPRASRELYVAILCFCLFQLCFWYLDLMYFRHLLECYSAAVLLGCKTPDMFCRCWNF